MHRISLRDPKLDCVRLLAKLGNEQMFEVTYVDIEERTSRGELQCLVQLSTMPVAVCQGIGPDQSAANNNAARNALEYLKLMTKKSVAAVNPAKEAPNATAKNSATNNAGPTSNGNKKSNPWEDPDVPSYQLCEPRYWPTIRADWNSTWIASNL